MHSSKLIQVLQTFSKEEVKDFNVYLNATIFSRRPRGQKYQLLFKIIHKYSPEYKAPGLKKEKVFKKIYPAETYNASKLEKIMGNLFALLQEFIVYRNSRMEEELNQIRVLSGFYMKKKLQNLTEINVKKYHKILQNRLDGDTVFFYDSFLQEKQIVNHHVLSYHPKKMIHFNRVHLSLDHYYLLEKLKLACQLLAIHRFLFPVVFEKEHIILDHLSPLLDAGFFEVPIIKVFYKAYKFLNDEEGNSRQKFLDFEKELELHYDSIPEEELIALSTIIRSYCVKQYDNGVEGYLEKTFKIYQDHLEKGYLYIEGNLFASAMMNIVVSGLRLNEYDWVLNFIQTHRERIIGIPSPNDAYRLNLAMYYFHTKNYEEALDLLADNYEDVYYKLRAKRMEIKIYFEMKHVLLNTKIDAFKIFVYRFSAQKISTKHKRRNREFIDILKQINLAKTFKNEKRINKLVAKINALSLVSEREWLLEKLETLR